MTTQHSPRLLLSSRRFKPWVLLVGILLVTLGSGVGYWLACPAQPSTSSERPPKEGPPVDSGPPWFRDITEQTGVHFTYRNGAEANHFTLLESLGGGVALLDYDEDGLLDVFLPGGGYFGGPQNKDIQGHPCKLYRNLGGWRFQDVTKEVGLDIPWFYTHGAAVADYDRDGWPDLVVTGYGRLVLFHNEPEKGGGRRFADVTAEVGLCDDSWSTSAGWADLDGDGFPDLYVCHYVDWSFANHPLCKGEAPGIDRDICPPQRFKPLLHALFQNEKGKRFRNLAVAQGFKAEGCGLGVVLADLNDDGRPDIYVANDASNNFLFLNRGGKLEEKGLEAGVALDNNGLYDASMGVDAGDYDGSGRASLWVTNYQNEVHALYANLGRELFQHRSHAAGVAALGQSFVGFGTGFVDVDNDGWEDLVIINGHVLRYPPQGSPVQQRPVLMRNVEYEKRRFFKDASAEGGSFFQTPIVGRGLAMGDLDNDGWPDLMVSRNNSPVVLLRNEGRSSLPRAPGWLGIKLVGKGNRDVVGSTVTVQGEGRRLTRYAKGGGSYLSAGDRRVLFGLGSAVRLDRVTVRWSWGRVQTWEGLRPGFFWELHEDEVAPTRLPDVPH